MKIQSITELARLAKGQRKALNLTQAELAEKIGVKPLWVSQFENGKSTVQLGIVLRALRVLQIPLEIPSEIHGEPSTSPHDNFPVINLNDVLDSTSTNND